jgi:hypothetical protein
VERPGAERAQAVAERGDVQGHRDRTRARIATSPMKWIVTERAFADRGPNDATQSAAHTHGFSGFEAFRLRPFAWHALDRIACQPVERGRTILPGFDPHHRGTTSTRHG